MTEYLDRIGHHIGDYLLLRWLGGGGFGNVYLAEHIRDHSQVAVKLLQTRLSRSDELKAFINEARIMRLKHPHIVPLLDFGISREEIPFLVMEYAVQGTVRDHYPKGTQVPLNTIKEYVLQVASALQYAHEQRLVHRDVKPENMLLRENGTLLLSDFGIASVAHSSHSLTIDQGIGGTIPYMAPEQIQGQARAASDQYSLGVVVYEWIAGRRPFEGTVAEVAVQHMVKFPSSLLTQAPALSQSVDQVVFKALAKDPRDRFVTVQDFAAALERAVQQVPSPPRSQPSMQPPIGSPSRPALPMPLSTDFETSPIAERLAQSTYEVSSQARLDLPPITPTPQSSPNNVELRSAPSNAVSTPNQLPTSSHINSATPLPFLAQPSRLPMEALSGVQGSSLSGSRAELPTISHHGGHLRGRTVLLVALVLIIIGSTSIFYIKGYLPIAHLQPTATAHTQVNVAATTKSASTATAATVHTQINATAVAAVSAYNRAIAANGAMFGFDAQHTHFNPYERVLNPANVSGLQSYWTFSADAPPHNAVDCSPAVVNGIVYVCSNNSRLYALDATTGKSHWAASMGSATEYYSSPAVADGVVYVGNSTGSNIQAFDTTTGTLRWTTPAGGFTYSSPAIANGVVYIGTFGSGLHAFDATTGKLRWTAPTDSFIYSSPAVANGVVYVGTYFGKVYAFDALTGQSRWIASTGDIIETSPTIANGIVYVSLDGQRLLALNASTGVTLWSSHTGGRLLSSPAVANGVVYVGSLDNKLYAFDATMGKSLWSASTGDFIETDPTVANGVVYIGSSNGKLYAFDATTGKSLWSASTGDSIIYSSPAIANGVVYIGSSDGKLYAFHLPGATS